MLLDELKNVALELTKYQSLNKDQFFTLMVSNKLDVQLEEYLKDLNSKIEVAGDTKVWTSDNSYIFLYKKLTEIQISETNKLTKQSKEKD